MDLASDYVCMICGYRTANLGDYIEHLDFHQAAEDYDPEDAVWLREERALMEFEEDLKRRLGTERMDRSGDNGRFGAA